MISLPVSEIESGHCILFLGAGFSREAKNSLGEPVRGGWELSDYLLDQINIIDKTDYDIETAAEEFAAKKGDAQLTNILRDNFITTNVTEQQRVVVCQPWYRIYTTNYDDVVERISHSDNKKISIKEPADPVEAATLGITQLVHLYGSISRASPIEFRRAFLLTESQRDNSPLLRSHWLSRFNDDVLTAPAVFFCGFALKDIDLRRLLGRLPPQVKDKTFFIDHSSASRPTQQRLNRFGSVQLIGVDGFARALGKKRLSAAPQISKAPPPAVQEVCFVPQTKAKIGSTDIQNLLVAGALNPSLLSNLDLDGASGSYTAKRSEAKFTRATRQSPARPILIHGDIGNGKSIFLQQVCYAYSIAGYKIYQLREEPENTADVLSFFQRIEDNCIVVADDLSRFRKLISQIIRLKNPNLRIVATARSNFFEAARNIVDARLADQSFTEIDLNLPAEDEIKNLLRYLDENGILGNYAELDYADRLHFIRESCGGQIRDVILSLFETGALHERVLGLVNSINGLPRDVYDLIILSALLSVIGLNGYSRLHITADLANYDGTLEDVRSAFADRELLGLVRVEQGDLFFRSPALAQFILERSAGLQRVLEVAKTALFQLDKSYADDPHFDHLTRSLLKISVYGRLFRSEKIEKLVDKFYDECRVLKIAKKDPLFLIQRSITNMNLGHYDISEKYVDTAYGMAKARKSYDTYQIDTHYAKLLLTISAHRGISTSIEREEKALDLIISVLNRRSDDLYHPLSVLRLFAEIAHRPGSSLSPTDRSKFRNTLTKALQRLHSVPSHVRSRFKNISIVIRLLDDALSRFS